MTNPDLVRLADELDGWHDCADGDVNAGNGHFRLVCVHDSEQQRLNLRATLREVSTALRRLPADAGMREAVRRLEELDCLYVNGERYPFGGIVGDPETATRREAIKECIAALTAPGATTKSDGGGKLEPAECPQDRSCAREPIGNTASSGQAVPGVAPGPSDPSSTRSEVTESLARAICKAKGVNPDCLHQNYGDEPIDHADTSGKAFHYGWRNQLGIVNALLETHQIRRK